MARFDPPLCCFGQSARWVQLRRVATVLENGEPVAVVPSPADLDRLDEQDHIRREAQSRLRRTIASIHPHAAEHDRDGIRSFKSPQAVAPHLEFVLH
jgi:hypothetical protein